MNKLLAFALLVALSACCPHELQIQTNYISKETLASYIIETPDPRLLNPPIGQRLMACWKLSSYADLTQNPGLNIRIRFRNREEIEQYFPINKRVGTYLYTILNEDYCRTGGILTYKISLVFNGQIQKEWKHQLWAELIEIPPEDDNNDSCKSQNIF